MSDTAVAPSTSLPEVAYPPAVSLRDAWPWLLLGFALLALFYIVGVDEGAASVVPGHVRARVGPRRAPPPRLPLPLRQRHASQPADLRPPRRALRRPARDRVRPGRRRGPGRPGDRVRAAKAKAAGEHEEAPIVSRTLQKSVGLLTAAVVYGLSLGGLFGSRSRRCTAASAAPARRGQRPDGGLRVRRDLPRAVRQISGEPAIRRRPGHDRQAHRALPDHDPDLAARGGGRGAPARPAGRALVGLDRDAARRCAATCSWWSWPAWALPPIQEVPRTFPAVTLFRFREASIGMQAVLWTTIGLVFAGTAQRVMTGQTIIPRRRSRSATVAASD